MRKELSLEKAEEKDSFKTNSKTNLESSSAMNLLKSFKTMTASQNQLDSPEQVVQTEAERSPRSPFHKSKLMEEFNREQA